MIIFGESTQSFGQTNDTFNEKLKHPLNVNSNIKTWDDALSDYVQDLRKMDFRSESYKQMVDGFCDTLTVAEDTFNEEEIAKGFIEALEEQRKFYETKANFYNNLETNIKFKLNEK